MLVSGNVKTKLEFLSSFTMSERMAINASTDPVIVDIMKLFDAAQFINLGDQVTINAVYYFASVGVIAATRAQEILGAS
jgi:hypothetical protein